MAGANDGAMAIAVARAGGLGALPCAMLGAEKIREEVAKIRHGTNGPFNLNFFCHQPPEADPDGQAVWKKHLGAYYEELGLDPAAEAPAVNRAPFDEAMCALVEETRPAVVSFHFGLPEKSLLQRVRAAGCRVLSSATTVEEARWLEAQGCDAVIAQGSEAGGHRGMFLSELAASQVGTMALVPQVVDAVSVPVIAAGGIADGRGVAAAFLLGAAGVQLGTAYLFTPQATISALHRQALAGFRDDGTALTNIFSGRPARGIVNRVMQEVGPLTDLAPAFPTAGGALAPLKAAAEAQGKADFTSMWSGQAAGLGQALDARDLSRKIMDDAESLLAKAASA